MSGEKTKKAVNIILTVLFCICLVLFMLTFAIGLPIYCRFFYYIQAEAMQLDRQSGFSLAQIRQAYDEVLNYCTLPWVNRFSSGSLKVSADAQAHFADCKTLFSLNLGVMLSSGAVTAVLLVLHSFGKAEILKICGHRAYTLSAAAAVALPVAVILIIAAVGFDKAFEGFHALFFPGKENWVFDWYEDEIIRIMPEEFFMNCAAIIAFGLIGFAAALITADLVLCRGRVKSHKNPLSFYVFLTLIIVETAIYIAFNTIMIGFGTETASLKYFGIILCFVAAALNCLSGNKDCLFVAGALFFTVVADLFLLVLDEDTYAVYGIAAFIVVQAIHFARIYVIRKKKPVISAVVRLCTVAAVLIVLAATGSLTALSAMAAIYFPQLVINAAESALLIKYSRRYIMLFIGLVLFVGCDICVGLFNFGEIGINVPPAAVDIITPAIWLFYLPSQVLITLSADPSQGAAQPLKKI